MNRRETFCLDEIALARAVPIEDEIARRGIKLKPEGRERVGPCPRCGGKDRFAVNTVKRVWNCRVCQRGGDIIDLVMHLDEVSFPTAVRTLLGERSAGRSSRRTRRENSDPEAEVKAALAIWAEASTDLGPLALSYLTRPRAEGGCGLVIQAGLAGRVLRFHGPHWWLPKGADKPIQAPEPLTRNRRIDLRPERDGTTTVTRATKVDFPVGTRIEISFDSPLPGARNTQNLSKAVRRVGNLHVLRDVAGSPPDPLVPALAAAGG
jgi:hypothetical protein